MAWLTFLSSVFFLLLAAHPFILYPLTLIAIRRWRREPVDDGRSPVPLQTMALCFCAYNEERVIPEKVANLRELRRATPGLEILAYVDGATDRSAALLRENEGEFTVRVSADRLGKTHGMNELLSLTSASIVVFTDANVIVDPRALVNLRRYFADPRVGCVCGHLRYVNAGATPTAATGTLYWRLEEWIKQLETDTGSAMGADGSLFGIRRSLHRPVPDGLIDDMFVSLSILCDGYRVIRAADVTAYEQSATSAREEFRRKIRIGCQCFNVHRLIWPRLRRCGALTVYKYVSHKLLRWVSGYSLAAAAVLFLLSMVLFDLSGVGAALGVLALVVLFLGSRGYGKFPAQSWNIVCALVGTGLGIWYSMRGEQFRTWTPATSVRD